MQTQMNAAITVLALIGCGGVNGSAMAACRVKTVAVESSTVVVSAPVAIGVPVAQAAPYYYSYQAYAPQTSYEPGEATVEAIAARVVEKLRGPNSTPPQGAPSQPLGLRPTAVSLVQQKCAVCHSGPQAKAGLRLDNLTSLDCAVRLKAIRAVLAEKMPKDGPRLTPEEAGKVLEELSAP
jgi:hypothetical protein